MVSEKTGIGTPHNHCSYQHCLTGQQLSKECGSQALLHHLFCAAVHTVMTSASIHLKHDSHLCITSAWPCILWTSLQQIYQPSISKWRVLAHTALWKTQFWTGAWGKGHFYNTIPPVTSPFLFHRQVQSLCNVHVICSWANTFLSLHCGNFDFLPFHKVGFETSAKCFLELKLLSLYAIYSVNNSTPSWNIV